MRVRSDPTPGQKTGRLTPAATREMNGFGRAVSRILDRKSTRLNSSHTVISYAVFCLKKKKKAMMEGRYTVGCGVCDRVGCMGGVGPYGGRAWGQGSRVWFGRWEGEVTRDVR